LQKILIAAQSIWDNYDL